jgi:hypothetical protein
MLREAASPKARKVRIAVSEFGRSSEWSLFKATVPVARILMPVRPDREL